MPKSRNRKKKGNKVQQIDVPRYLISSYNGTPMRVPNPAWKPGKRKIINHGPERPPSLGEQVMDWDGG